MKTVSYIYLLCHNTHLSRSGAHIKKMIVSVISCLQEFVALVILRLSYDVCMKSIALRDLIWN